ncbi:MAG: hypothetical protein ACXVJB_00200 [Mucilaginibacter sp.]
MINRGGIVLSMMVVLMALASCYKESSPQSNQVIVNLFTNGGNAPADGASQVAITAELPGNTQSGQYNITFSTTNSVFFDSQKSSTTISTLRPQPDSANRFATALLVCPATVGTATVTTTVQDISRSVQVNFIPALPQSVKLTGNAQFINATATSEITLNLALIRSIGIATAGQSVQAWAVDSLNNPIGNFRNGNMVLSDKTGNATLYFSLNQSTYLGKITIKVWLQTTPSLSDQITITAIKSS